MSPKSAESTERAANDPSSTKTPEEPQKPRESRLMPSDQAPVQMKTIRKHVWHHYAYEDQCCHCGKYAPPAQPRGHGGRLAAPTRTVAHGTKKLAERQCVDRRIPRTWLDKLLRKEEPCEPDSKS